MSKKTDIRLDLERWRRIEQIGVCASRDAARPVLAAVNIEPGEDRLTVTATDSYRLATTVVEADCQPGDPFLLPAKPVKDVRLAIGKVAELGKNPDVVLSVTKRQARVVALDEEETSLFSQTIRLSDGKFPTYESLFPSDDEGLEGFTKAELVDFIGRFGELNGLSERSRKPDLIRAAQQHKIGPSYAAFNPKYVALMADSAGASDRYPVAFRVRGPLKPVVLTCPSDPHWRGIIMPVRI